MIHHNLCSLCREENNPHLQAERYRQFQKEIRESVSKYGFFVMMVMESVSSPPFSYTIGLHRTNPTLSDFLIVGLSDAQRRAFIYELAIGSLQGRSYREGCSDTTLTENGMPFFFGRVDEKQYDK